MAATETIGAERLAGADGPVARDLRLLSAAGAAGLIVGAVVNGLGSRLVMRLLFLTNPGTRGVTSDDGFIIGTFSLGDTLSLIGFATFVGVLGALVYVLIAPLRFGPGWFHRTAIVIGPAVVIGDMLIHSDGIDFRVLGPTWLAVGLFIALPAASATATATLVDRWQRPTSWALRSRWQWLVGLAPLAFFTPAILGALAVRHVERSWSAPRRETVRRWLRLGGRLWLTTMFATALVGLTGTVLELT